MTRGVLMFAFDNDQIKYTSMADWSAERIQRLLGLPTTVVTDQSITLDHADVVNTTSPQENGKRWFDDMEQTVAWNNKNRFNAYRLSPYDETILLDADYVVASDQLLKCFDINQSIAPMGSAYDLTGVNNYTSLNHFGNYQFPMSWATVVYFCKNPVAKLVFDLIETIQDNWNFYRQLYSIPKSQYRNDFALSIAMNTIFGNRAKWPVLPWNMASLDPGHHLAQIDQDDYEIKYLNQQKQLKKLKVQQLDFHAMGKSYLGDIIEGN